MPAIPLNAVFTAFVAAETATAAAKVKDSTAAMVKAAVVAASPATANGAGNVTITNPYDMAVKVNFGAGEVTAAANGNTVFPAAVAGNAAVVISTCYAVFV